MNTLIQEAYEFQQFAIRNGWDFYFIGGLALQYWGEPRLTRDIDLHVFTNFQDEEAFIAKILAAYKPKFSDVASFALTERLLPVVAESGITIDVVLSGLADVSASLARSGYQVYTNDISLKICSAEDLIILKTIAGRSRDWPDVESVLIKQTSLDWEYIESTISTLFEYEVDLRENLDILLEKKKEFFRP